MYLWDILQRDTEEEFISEIYHTQKLIAINGTDGKDGTGAAQGTRADAGGVALQQLMRMV